MKPSATITAILCVHDDPAWLPQALSSVVGQTRPADEILVVKSAQTPDMVDGLAKQFGAIAVQQEAPGLAAARNFGIFLAQGNMVAFLDCDDVWEKDKTAYQLHHLEAANLDAVTGQLLRFADGAGEGGAYSAAHFTETVPALTPGGLLVKKSVFDTVGLFDTRYRIACDHEWFMRLTAGPVQWEKMDNLVLRKRIHPGNLSHRTAEYRREIMEILRERQI
ncbi:MAG: glycosyltransferase family A protein [Saprospiraceae bacterium]